MAVFVEIIDFFAAYAAYASKHKDSLWYDLVVLVQQHYAA